MPPCGARRPSSACSAVRTASPVPSGGSCTTLSAGETIRATLSICCPTTTTLAAGDRGCKASNKCAIIGRPAIGCMTLGIADFIRVPLPAARMMAANRGWLIDSSKRTENMSGCSLARHRRGYNSQIVAKYSTTTQSLSRWKGSSSSPTRLSAYSLSPLARLVRPSSVPNPRSSPAPHGVARRYG